MKELNIYPIHGLFNELYNPDINSLSLKSLVVNGKYSLKNASGLFWALHLAEPKIRKLLDKLSKKYYFSKPLNPQYLTILSNPDFFIDKVKNAPFDLCNQGKTQKDFFSVIETLAILCKLYSELEYFPHNLSIQEGFENLDMSSELLIGNCLNPTKNPYYQFLLDYCWPIIKKYKPSLIWLYGPIKISTFTLAMLSRLEFPDVHISIIGHSSEYYSLNKIANNYLKLNTYLFKIIDSIILEDIEHTQPLLIKRLDNKLDFEDVPNLMYVDKEKGEIIQTNYKISIKNPRNWIEERPHNELKKKNNSINPDEIINIKLWPNSKCYWRNCTFCGINKKYHTLPIPNDFIVEKEHFKIIEEIAKKNCKYLWLIDEAVPPGSLYLFGKFLLEKNIKISWQARSRIDFGFTDEICELLANSGLKEIRLGLESANLRILKLMNKFSDDFTFEKLRELLSNFDKHKISVHFPMIIGFPTETFRERLDTYSFLHNIREEFPLITFNINTLGLDVSSPLYANFEKYEITTIEWPCSSKFFLGNFVKWDSLVEHYDQIVLDLERNNFMRNELYSWMPDTSTIPVFIFYRLSETSRNTLIWKTNNFYNPNSRSTEFRDDLIVIKSPSVIVSNYINNTFLVYDWKTHNYTECDNYGKALLDIFSKPMRIKDGITNLYEKFFKNSNDFDPTFKKYYINLKIAFEKGFIIEQ